MSYSLPCTTDEADKNWRTAADSYLKGSYPKYSYKVDHNDPEFVALMKTSQTYYYNDTTFGTILKYATERWPLTMGLDDAGLVLTNRQAMINAFGYSQPYYWGLAATGAAPPIMGVVTKTKAWLGPRKSPGEEVFHVFNMIGMDFSTSETAHSMWLSNFVHDANRDTAQELLSLRIAAKYAKMWYLAFVAAKDLGLKRISNVEVGGGAFCPVYLKDEGLFTSHVHHVAFYLLGYGTADFEAEFPGIRLVEAPKNVPKDLTVDMVDMLHINAWDPSSFVGNGNELDNTLDGGWGRATLMAPLCWPLSNPYMRFSSVDVEKVERAINSIGFESDRMCLYDKKRARAPPKEYSGASSSS